LTGLGGSGNILPSRVLDKHEENVSAEQQKTQENARFPGPHEDQGRARGHQEQKAQGSKACFCRMNERLTPLERIRKKSDFSSLYREGNRFRGRHFSLVFRRNELGHSRLAVVASRKVGSAVVRNRVKRRLRELFRRNKELLVEPIDLIVIARPESGGAPWAEVKESYISSLTAIFRKRISS
jgi:ribonuclease P protein component